MAGGAVAGSVLAHDGLLKRWRLPGALAMGACRTTNALLGPIALGLWSPLAPDGPGSGALAYALLVGAYVVGLTWVSTFEDRSPDAAEQAGAFSATAGAPLAALLLSLLSGGWSPLGAVGWLPLARVVWGQAWAAALGDAGAHGRTVALLKGLWLLDLGLAAAALSGGALASGLVVLGCLFAGGKLAAARLWGKPPGPAPAGAPAGGGT